MLICSPICPKRCLRRSTASVRACCDRRSRACRPDLRLVDRHVFDCGLEAAEFDPGTTGFVIAVAVDQRGCPTIFNALMGDEYVKFATGHQANLTADAAAALNGLQISPPCDDNSFLANLRFDGFSYNLLGRVLALSNIPDRASGNNTMLILNRIGGNLGIGASTLGTVFGILYDDSENSLRKIEEGRQPIPRSLPYSLPVSGKRENEYSQIYDVHPHAQKTQCTDNVFGKNKQVQRKKGC